MKKLPLSITTFADIQDKEENYLYIDKTADALKLITQGKYYFLNRPRRFGKSLFIDTLKSIFQAEKELFTGLVIENKWDWNIEYPVISIDLNAGDFSTKEGIERQIFTLLKSNQNRLGIACDEKDNIPSCFNDVIEKTYNKYQQKVVILVDEYDKPVLDNISNKGIALEARNTLKNFYSVIKSNDRYIKFVFITGVSKFSKMNLFSGLNNLIDITTMSDYATICGYTHNDVIKHFSEHLNGVDLDKLKNWYNGYNFYPDCQECSVYNPFDILLFINNHFEYKNYWWETGNPQFLIEKLKEQNYYIPKLENIIVSEEILNTFDINNIDLIALLWQTGYLTFSQKVINFDETYNYQLKVPNKEIQKSLNQLFINYLTNQPVEALSRQKEIYQDIANDIANLQKTLTSLFAAIPYNNYANNIIANYEGYYSSVVFTYLMSLGFPCIPEDVTNKGRIDLTIKLPKRTIIIEFKVDSNESALAQIKQKKYYEKYQNEGNEIIMVGICFDSAERNITEFEWEEIR